MSLYYFFCCHIDKNGLAHYVYLFYMRSVKDGTELMVGNLQSEVKTLKTKYNELKHSVLEDELEKQVLRK